MIFREDLEEIFGKRAWDPELTEKPVTQSIVTEVSQNVETPQENNSQELHN